MDNLSLALNAVVLVGGIIQLYSGLNAARARGLSAWRIVATALVLAVVVGCGVAGVLLAIMFLEPLVWPLALVLVMSYCWLAMRVVTTVASAPSRRHHNPVRGVGRTLRLLM
jgi:hypothetical protein